MHHIFNKLELKEFVQVLCINSKVFDKEFKYIEDFYTDAISWDRKLICHNHFLSIVIEQLEKAGIDNTKVVDFIYSQEEKCHFEIQEGSMRFLESLFENDCSNSLSLEEQLIIAQNKLEK